MSTYEPDPMFSASSREREIEEDEERQFEAWEGDDEWAGAEHPQESMQDIERALSLAAELDRLAQMAAPPDEIERIGPARQQGELSRQQGELFPHEMYRLEVA